MKDFIKFMDTLPWVAKLILCIPALDIVWAVYRIVKGIVKNDLVLVTIGVLWIVPGAALLWIVDAITTIMYKHPKLT